MCRLRSGGRLNSAEQKYICHNSKRQIECRDAKRPNKGLPCGHQVTGDNWRGNSGELIGEIHDPAHLSDVAFARDERWNRPANRRCSGEAADRHADPNESLLRAMRVSRTKDSKTARSAAYQDDPANHACIEATLNQFIHQPPSHQDVKKGCNKPWDTCVKKR